MSKTLVTSAILKIIIYYVLVLKKSYLEDFFKKVPLKERRISNSDYQALGPHSPLNS